MKAANRTLLWAEIFVDELARAGLGHVCIAPGSRSTPLALAFAACPAIKVHSLLDERGAAFFGLGLALALEAPVALLCTSGTATVNFHPAIAEAYYAQVPLLVLTADRPHEVRDSGANQTMDQVKLYGDHVRWFVDVAPPEANPPAKTLRYLRALACRALATAAGSPPGPVHLNFPFRKPLEPIPVPGDLPAQPERPVAWALEGRGAGQPFTALSRGLLAPSPQQVETLAAVIGGARRGLIICGPRCPGGEFPQAVLDLAQAAGFPVLADALSGVRFSTGQPEARGGVLGGYETFLQKEGASRWAPPEVILQFGAMPTSQALINYLEALSEQSRHILITGSGVWTDETHSLSDLLWADPALTCRAVAQTLESKPLAGRDLYWRAAWEEAEKTVWQTVETAGQEGFFEGLILADIIEAMPHSGLLYVASSLPVRHLDQFVPAKSIDLRVFANRGVSGIDGTISSALGAAAATESPLVLVIGDVAFYHDLNGLLALQRGGLKATIVLINNDGGGIFHRLPIAQFDPPFSELFLTPHGLQFEPVVRMFGAEYQKATSREAFRQAFQQALQADQSWVIEFPTDSVRHEESRRKIIKQVGERLALVKK